MLTGLPVPTLASLSPDIHQAHSRHPSCSLRASSSSSCPGRLLTQISLPALLLPEEPDPLLYSWRLPFPPHLSSGFLPPLLAPLVSYLHPHSQYCTIRWAWGPVGLPQCCLCTEARVDVLEASKPCMGNAGARCGPGALWCPHLLTLAIHDGFTEDWDV